MNFAYWNVCFAAPHTRVLWLLKVEVVCRIQINERHRLVKCNNFKTGESNLTNTSQRWLCQCILRTQVSMKSLRHLDTIVFRRMQSLLHLWMLVLCVALPQVDAWNKRNMPVAMRAIKPAFRYRQEACGVLSSSFLYKGALPSANMLDNTIVNDAKGKEPHWLRKS